MRSNSQNRAWVSLAALVLLCAPWLVLLGLGFAWLLAAGLWLPWLLALLACSAVAVFAFWRLRPNAKAPPLFQPDGPLSPSAEAAWARVEKLAEACDSPGVLLKNPAQLLPHARQIVEAVAGCFQPGHDSAEWEVSLPDLLLLTEHVSHDLREMLMEQVPTAHLITVKGGLRLWRWQQSLKKLGIVSRIGHFVASPVGGILYELRMVFFKRLTRYPLVELERWLVQSVMRKIGYYAILLYSGELRTAAEVEGLSLRSAADWEAARKPLAEAGEPLRILVAGQTKSGKSSVINALFGELRAPVDALPLTAALSPYELRQDGEFLGLVFDSPGYGDQASWVGKNRLALEKMDCLILVCAATQAGRAADVQFLAELQAAYAPMPRRLPPPVVVALTHIDLLRPLREWSPPYQIAEPTGQKAVHIRQCLEDIADTLAVPPDRIQAVCLKSGQAWNVEALWTAIAAQLPEARRARYLRCLKDTRAREKWELVMKQLAAAGRVIANKASKMLGKN